MSDPILCALEDTKQKVSNLQVEHYRALDRNKKLEENLASVMAENTILLDQRRQLEQMIRDMTAQSATPMPKGKALLYTFNGPVHVQDIEWAHAFNALNPQPLKHVLNPYGRSFQLLYWKKDIAHQNAVLALYVAE